VRTYPLPGSSHSAIARYIISFDGNERVRSSQAPASSTAASTASSGNTVASSPIDTSSVSRLAAHPQLARPGDHHM
jgi:hypothetical protein